MSKRPRGHIHRIREFELEKVNLVEEFDILQIVGEGWFGKILLVEHRASQTEMVLKAVPKPYVSLRDFYREFHYGLHLGIHRNIVTTFDVAFETAGFYVFTQEYAPLGDLTSNVTDTGVGEVHSKRVAKQIASALDYMHSKDIVHRDVKLDNVLIYRSDFSRVKLCDFGESYQTGTIVERRNEWLPYSPPEVLDVKPEGTYQADPSHDVWQFAIVIFVCLTGCLPWQKAQSDDPRYARYVTWHDSMMFAIRRTPKLFKLLTNKAQRMFRRFLDPRFERRPKSLSDLSKFLDDRWLAKTAEKEMAEYESDELCPSMYSFHSSPDEKNRLLYTLADCGIETNVDRQSKKARIKDWIESSIIAEEDEEEAEETNSASPSSSVSREPVRGHISSIRTPKDIKTTLKDATQKHFDPRTGALQQGPSEMGVNAPTQRAKSLSPTISQLSTANNNDSICSSLLTIDSQQELLNSQLTLNNSNLRLHNADEEANTGGYKQLSLMARNYNNPNGLISNNSNNNNNNEMAAIFASSPNINRLPQQQYGNAASSTTLTGLTSAFQTLAQISLPMGGAYNSPQQQQQFRQQQQPPAQLPFGYNTNNINNNNGNLQRNDSQMRESGYGSADVSELSLTRTNSNSSNQQSRNYKQMPPHMTQQIPMEMRHNNSMKDTAYDRALFSNNRR